MKKITTRDLRNHGGQVVVGGLPVYTANPGDFLGIAELEFVPLAVPAD